MKRIRRAIPALAWAAAFCAPTAMAVEVPGIPGASASGDKMADAQRVVGIHVDAGDGSLSAEIHTVGDAFIEIAGEPGVVTGNLLALAIDADNNPATGKSPKFSFDAEGFEWQANVEVCGHQRGSSEVHCSNGFWGRELAGASARVTVLSLADAKVKDKTQTGATILAPGRVVPVAIPYTAFGASAGQTVRIQALGWTPNGMFGPIGESIKVVLD